MDPRRRSSPSASRGAASGDLALYWYSGIIAHALAKTFPAGTPCVNVVGSRSGSPPGAGVERGRLVVSSIDVWFREDFGGDDRGVIAHLGRYVALPLAQALAGVERIAEHGYDWSLNGAKPSR